MLERLRTQIGTAGLVVAIVALVAALGGGAYAASNNGAGKATASAKAKQGKQGKPGKTGPAGPQGPAGPAGAQGPAGPKGDTGAPGANGTNGTNGTDGVEGPEGSPWTAGGTLPPGATETGTWTLGFITEGSKPTGPFSDGIRVPISFTIPLAEPLVEGQVHYIKANGKEYILNASEEFEEIVSADCHGSAENPTADPGNLCVYTGELSNAVLLSQLIHNPAGGGPFVGGASTAGAYLSVAVSSANASGSGTWAVTGQE